MSSQQLPRTQHLELSQLLSLSSQKCCWIQPNQYSTIKKRGLLLRVPICRMEEILYNKYRFLPLMEWLTLIIMATGGKKTTVSLKHRKHGCSCCKIDSDWQYIQFQQSSTEVFTPPFLWNDIYYQAKLQRGICTFFFCIPWYKMCQFIAVSDMNC